MELEEGLRSDYRKLLSKLATAVIRAAPGQIGEVFSKNDYSSPAD